MKRVRLFNLGYLKPKQHTGKTVIPVPMGDNSTRYILTKGKLSGSSITVRTLCQSA